MQLNSPINFKRKSFVEHLKPLTIKAKSQKDIFSPFVKDPIFSFNFLEFQRSQVNSPRYENKSLKEEMKLFKEETYRKLTKHFKKKENQFSRHKLFPTELNKLRQETLKDLAFTRK